MTDEEIALSIQQGNSEALAELAERHYGLLMGYLYRVLNGDRQQAEDLVQETFMKVAREIEHYSYPRPFKPWLYAIALNLARNHYRNGNQRAAARNDVPDKLPDGAEPIETEVMRRGEAEQMMALLRKLPDQQREAIVLRYLEEFSQAEIAEVLNVPVGTVKSRVSLGLSRLRTLMQENDKR